MRRDIERERGNLPVRESATILQNEIDFGDNFMAFEQRLGRHQSHFQLTQ